MTSEEARAIALIDNWSKAQREQKAATTAPDYLRRAAEIMDERGRQYDSPKGERSMGRCVAAFNALTGRDLTEADGWLLLQLLKDARQWSGSGFHRDSAEDCTAYSALKAEALERASTDERLPIDVALETALSVLEQIATAPRNRGAKRSAAATLAFLRTRLDMAATSHKHQLDDA